MSASGARPISSYFSSSAAPATRSDRKKGRGDGDRAERDLAGVRWLDLLAAQHVHADAGVASPPPGLPGIHAAVECAFGNPAASRAMDLSREIRRSGHSVEAGKRMHACAQHALVCERVSDGERRAAKRRVGPNRCPECEHPRACRARNCAAIQQSMARWAREHALVPVMAEAPIYWHRQEIASRCDMLCVREADLDAWWEENAAAAATADADPGPGHGGPRRRLPPLVVVSLKTLGEGAAVPRARGGRGARLPRSVSRAHVPDCEATRHQLQLMMEVAVLRDTYGVEVRDAVSVYLAQTRRRDGARGRVAVECRTEEKAGRWWESVARAAARITSISAGDFVARTSSTRPVTSQTIAFESASTSALWRFAFRNSQPASRPTRPFATPRSYMASNVAFTGSA